MIVAAFSVADTVALSDGANGGVVVSPFTTLGLPTAGTAIDGWPIATDLLAFGTARFRGKA